MNLLVDNPVDLGPEGSHYLEQPAIRPNIEQDNELSNISLRGNLFKILNASGFYKEAFRVSVCGQKWRPLDCKNNHGPAFKRIVCNLPYCPTCGKRDSWLNKRRAKRVRETLLGFPVLGNFVFTIPKSLSATMPDSKQLNKLYKLAWQILSYWFAAEAAVIILHFFGDEKHGLHLHFDCSFPILHTNGSADYPPGIIDAAKRDWTTGVNNIFLTTFLCTVGHYQFDFDLGQQLHWTNYATRSTMPTEKLIELPEEQRNYCFKMRLKKIIRYFGGFDSKHKKEFLAKYQNKFVFEMIKDDSGDPIDRCVCPICGEKMHPVRYKNESWVWMDDISLMNFVRYDGDTFVSREIYDYLKQQESKKAHPPSLLEEFIATEAQWWEDLENDLLAEEF